MGSFQAVWGCFCLGILFCPQPCPLMHLTLLSRFVSKTWGDFRTTFYVFSSLKILLHYPIPRICDSSSSKCCSNIQLCFSDTPCYSIKPRYGVSPCYGVSLCSGVALCYFTFVCVTRPEYPRVAKDEVNRPKASS